MTAVVLLCIQNFLYKNISQQLNHSLFTLNFLLSFSEVLLLTLKKQTTLFQLPGLFDGCQFYFDGSFVYPTPEKSELVALVKAGSGQVVTREPRLQILWPTTAPRCRTTRRPTDRWRTAACSWCATTALGPPPARRVESVWWPHSGSSTASQHSHC